MANGKTITLYLIDGEANGRVMCELSNWTGKAYKIPRNHIKSSSDRDDLKQSGIYLLFGNDGDNQLVYIGESDNVYSRLCEHNKDAKKDFWNEAIVFVSKDNQLNKAHIRFLEHRLHYIAKEVGRYVIQNNNIPTRSNISESDEADMEKFIEDTKMLIEILGHKIFEPIRREKTEGTKGRQIFCISARGIKAYGEMTNEGFVIYKGSEIAPNIVPSLASYSVKNRKKIIDKGLTKVQDEKLVLIEDTIFSSPSSASVFVLGRQSNGLLEWKFSEDMKITLKSILESNQ